MSTQTSPLPDPQTAYNNLFGGVHERVFFTKCAAAGFAPRSPEEARWMLETTGKLRRISDAHVVKEAAAQDNPFFRMNSDLDAVMAKFGLDGPTKQAAAQEVESGYKEAAAHLMTDPTMYNSVLSLAAHEAQEQLASLNR